MHDTTLTAPLVHSLLLHFCAFAPCETQTPPLMTPLVHVHCGMVSSLCPAICKLHSQQLSIGKYTPCGLYHFTSVPVPCLAQSPAFYAFFMNPLFAPCTAHLLPVLAFVNCPSRKLLLVILLFYVDLFLEFYMLTKIGRIRIAWGWSGKRVVIKLQSWSVNAFVRVSPSCWSVLVIVGVGPSWGRIRVTVECR